jgi:regulator of nucleoside diphosphate kinase
MNLNSTLVITDTDARRLRKMLEGTVDSSGFDRANRQILEEEIDKAVVVPSEQVPPNVVTMHSRVRIVDMRTGEQMVYQIVYPHEANYSERKISILAPIGTALLGYSAGAEIDWNVPSGSRRLWIAAVEQPHAISSDSMAA